MYDYYDYDEAPRRFWTCRRLVLAIIALILVLILLLNIALPVIQGIRRANQPQPTLPPAPMVWLDTTSSIID